MIVVNASLYEFTTDNLIDVHMSESVQYCTVQRRAFFEYYLSMTKQSTNMKGVTHSHLLTGLATGLSNG